ncbi:MAG: PSD1 and planctomycete cytochrome C domain-containing protein [Acidobacteria bacterium]|nr:PSD1 and planctomycete cytochrome C domain-containing protein [Acidobacteriota bacterium]
MAPLPLLLALAIDPAQLFITTIQPTLKRHCLGCHGEGQILSKLDLRTREALLQGGTRGPAITPGNAQSSPLFQLLKSGQMPPGKPLPAETITAFETWINSGAPWLESNITPRWNLSPADLWAFQPIPKSEPIIFPKATTKADPRTLIRRTTIDLTGLPPTPTEVQQFLNDKSPKAYENLIDRLLASPRFGERMARHWLDVVRYADTGGYSNDFERPNAWRYRDYVIRAFNENKPYDQFVREQIAGDELYPQSPDARIATGFLRMGPWEHTGMSVEAQTRQMFLDDVTASNGTTIHGHTTGSARFHDHDYYRLQAVFATTEFARPNLPFLPTENLTHISKDRERLHQIHQRTKALMDSYGNINRPNFPPEDYEAFKVQQKHLALYKESLDRFEPKAFTVSSGPLDGATDGGPNLKYPKREAYQPTTIHILPSGNIQSPAEPVTPGTLTVIKEAPIPDTIEGRRAALALWITDKQNPLTPRVIANRIWQIHFGKGLAADSNNFGKMGAKPTDPKLLDQLAAFLLENNYNLKALHKQILLSAHYQSKDLAPRRIEAEVLRDSILAVSGELSLEAGGPGTFPQINDDVARQPQHRMGTLAPPYFPSPEKSQRNRRTIYTVQQRSLIDPIVDVFNAPSLDLSCDRRETSTVPTQAFALFNSQFAHDMALAFAARLDKEAPTPKARITRAFELAFARPPTPIELQLSLTHLAKMTTHHKQNPPPPIEPAKPIIHSITSELTGEIFTFTQTQPSTPIEPNLHPSQVSPATRALADLTLSLINSNEFLYVY